jgi:hypothetical protein
MRWYDIEEANGEKLPCRVKVFAESFEAAVTKLRALRRGAGRRLKSRQLNTYKNVNSGSVQVEGSFEDILKLAIERGK